MKIDLLLKNVNVFNSYIKQFVNANVAILDGKVLYVDKSKCKVFEAKKVMECNNKFLVPGLIDIHMHIESSMTTPEVFCETVASYGVTSIVSEPHEIANVKGIRGVEAMIEGAKNAKIDVFYGIPSSVPSTDSSLETTGDIISFEDMNKLSDTEGVICVGEVMNYRGVIEDDTLEICKFLKHLKKTKPNFIVEGHCPRLVDLDLAKFLYLGINGDHTEHSLEEVKQRIENGMFMEIQHKMLKKEIIDYIVENNLYEHIGFVTDDVMPDILVNEGHLNLLIKRAIELGMSPENAIYCGTFTPARRMNLTDRGAIAPGKLADMLLLESLQEFDIAYTFKNGEIIYDKSKGKTYSKQKYRFPEDFYKSVNIKSLKEEDLDILVPNDKVKDGHVLCRVMEVNDGGTFTKEVERRIRVVDGKLDLSDSDCLYVEVFERYGKNNNIGFGLVTGDIIKSGAVATTYAHDHHNLLVVGKSKKDMIIALNNVVESSGGFAVANNNEILAKVELSIGGILSEDSMDVLGFNVSKVKKSLVELGYKHYNPIMSLCTLSLPVSPELKITDKGIVRVKERKVVDLFI